MYLFEIMLLKGYLIGYNFTETNLYFARTVTEISVTIINLNKLASYNFLMISNISRQAEESKIRSQI